MTVDTLSLAKELREAELSTTQAEAIAAAIGRAVLQGTATKADVQVLRSDLEQVRSETRGEFALVRSDLEQVRSETRGEFALVRSDLEQLRSETRGEFALVRREMAQVRADFVAEIEKVRSGLLTYFIATIVSIAAVIVAVVKL